MAKQNKKSKLLGRPQKTQDAKSGEIKITIFDYDEKNYSQIEAKTAQECAPFKEKPTVTWINVDGLRDVDTLEKICGYYAIHHIVLEDILKVNQRPKIEDFGEYIYLAVKMLSYDEAKNEINEEQISMILAGNFLLTFQEEKKGDVFEGIRDRIKSDKGRIRKMGADYLAYALLDAVIDNYFIVLEKIDDKMELLEEDIVNTPGKKTMQVINSLKRDLIFIRKLVWPLREVINGIVKSDSDLVKEQTLIYYRDIYDHAVQAVDTVEALRDMLSGMLDVCLSSLSNKLNETMKFLTIISTIFIPLTFIAGIYGMNFNTNSSKFNMPELNWPFGYLFVLTAMFVAACVMIVYFKRKKWF